MVAFCAVLKINREHDIESAVAKTLKPLGYQIVPKLYYEGSGRHVEVEYHCWVTERCIPLVQLAALNTRDKNACVLAACRCIARAAQCRIHVSDCHYNNLGVRIASGDTEHEVVIIDAGSRGLLESVPPKAVINKVMVSLWKWTEKEMQASPISTQSIWRRSDATTLEDVVPLLDKAWQSRPYLTDPQMRTSHIDNEITNKCFKALREFIGSTQGRIVQLIGSSSVNWWGGAWNDSLSELCMRAVEEANITFDSEEDKVLSDLYERITTLRTRNETRTRTTKEIEDIVAFWWKLQEYRIRYVERKGRIDTPEEVLSEEGIKHVKRNWEKYEM